MQGLITCILILAYISSCLCHRWNVGTQNTIYNVMNYGAVGDGKSDDTQAYLKAWQNTCAAEGTTTLVIPQNYIFLVTNLTLNGPCIATSIQIQLQGQIVAPTKDAWLGNPYTLIEISNVNGLTIDGSGGLINGYGSTWWNCKTCQRPTLLVIRSCNYLRVSNLNIINSPKSHIHVNGCEGATFSYINISAPIDSPNTDGFDISTSKNILIENSTIATGDDCIAISGGSSYINVSGIACGPGHGISIGSLGKKYDTVQDVHVRNCSFKNTKNGARIKSFSPGMGYAKHITFEEITLEQAGLPIIIDKYYASDSITTDAVEVNDVTFRGFQGTSTDERAIVLNCGDSGCYGLVLDQINIVSSLGGKPASCFCSNAHGTATATNPNCSCLLP